MKIIILQLATLLFLTSPALAQASKRPPNFVVIFCDDLGYGDGGTYEGGMREPTIFWQPGTIKPGVVTDIGATLDLLPTFCALAGVQAPTDRVLDGYDLTPVLHGKGRSPRQTMFYWRGSKLNAVRHGAFKAHFITQSEYGGEPAVTHDPPLLYNLDHDPSEKYHVAANHPEVIAEIRRLAEAHIKAIPPVENQLDKRMTATSRK